MDSAFINITMLIRAVLLLFAQAVIIIKTQYLLASVSLTYNNYPMPYMCKLTFISRSVCVVKFLHRV